VSDPTIFHLDNLTETQIALSYSQQLREQAITARNEIVRLLDLLEAELIEHEKRAQEAMNSSPEPDPIIVGDAAISATANLAEGGTHRVMDPKTLGPIPPEYNLTDAQLTASNDALTKRIDGIIERLDIVKRTTKVETEQTKSWRAITGAYSLWIIDIALIITFFVVGHGIDSRSQCQARVNDATRSSLVQRADAQTKSNRAQEELFNVVLNPTSTPADKFQASINYRNGLRAAQAQRDANPLPTENCS
jgi:hypothetical protein